MVEAVNIHKYGYTILQIETMSVCNMMCRFCAYPDRTDKGKTLSERMVYDIIDSLEIDNAFEYVCFSHFNEPLMDNRIYSFIGYAKKRHNPVLLVTNGLLFRSKDVIDRLIEASPDRIKISLQVLDADLYKGSRGISSSFDEYKRGIIEFVNSAGGCSSKIVIDLACNFLSAPSIMKSRLLGLEHGDPSIYDSINDLKDKMKLFLMELQSSGGRFRFDPEAFDRHIEKVCKDYSSQDEYRLDTNISMKVKPFLYGKRLADFYPLKKGARCSNRILGILASGSVVPCCLAYGDILSMGNVNDSSLAKILNDSTGLLSRIRQGENSPATCRRCLGAPTKRGVFLKDIRNAAMDSVGWNS